MMKFNGNRELSENLNSDIERHFKFQWENDRNKAVSNKDVVTQLPLDTQDFIYTQFLFTNFLRSFRSFFTIFNIEICMHKEKQERNLFTWQDEEYSQFML